MEQGNKRLIEKRKYIRLPFETRVRYKIEGQKQKNLEMAKSYNISPEGLCIILKKPIKKGAILNIEITIKELPPFAIKGEVLWVKDADNTKESMVGVKIMDIGNNERSRFLLELCDKMVNELGQKYPEVKF